MRILSWNIQWGRGLDGTVDLARIARTIRSHGTFDVICLQEVAVNFPGLAGSRGEDQAALLAAEFQDHHPVFAPATDVPDAQGHRKQFGNLLLSRLPVGQVWRHLLPWPADAAVPSMQRVLLEAVVGSGASALRVLTTHLEYYSAKIRRAQIDAIRGLQAEACAQARAPRAGDGEAGGSFEVFARPATAVLCGDMNFAAAAPERQQMLAPFADGTPAWRDGWEVLHGDAPHPATAGVHKQSFTASPQCYDFFFLSANLAPRLRRLEVDATTTASDHQPVWIELATD